MIRAGIIGSTGYAGQEIVRILDHKAKSLNKYFDEKEGKKWKNFCRLELLW